MTAGTRQWWLAAVPSCHWRQLATVLAVATAAAAAADWPTPTQASPEPVPCAAAITADGDAATFCASAGTCAAGRPSALAAPTTAVNDSQGRDADRGHHHDLRASAASAAAAGPSTCTFVDPVAYVQRAVYWVAGRDSAGHADPAAGRRGGTVTLSGGEHTVRTALSSWYPFGQSTALHLPSGVELRGDGDGSTTVTLADCLVPWPPAPAAAAVAAAASPPSPPACAPLPLTNFVLVSDNRVGAANMSTDEQLAPAVNVSLRGFTLVGGPDAPCDSPQDAGARAFNGVSVNAKGVSIVDVGVRRVVAGVSGGYFCQFLPASPAVAANPNCSTNGWCEARRLMMTDAVVRRVSVCAAEQGVTVIGRNVLVSSCNVTLTTKTWTEPGQAFGVTMAVSAGFVGTANVSVRNNTLTGGDYSVGADGSFPLWMSVPVFVNHWGDILEQYPSFKSLYPNGPARDGKLLLNGTNFILASQVLLDAASRFHAASANTSYCDQGYNVGLSVRNNTCVGAVSGVSLYRTTLSDVTGNAVRAAAPSGPPGPATGGLAKYGAVLGMSHNNSVAGNRVEGRWEVGVLLDGAGVEDPRGCGPCQSRYGAAWNDVTGNAVHLVAPTSPPTPASRGGGIVLGLRVDCAGGNVVTGNRVVNGHPPCNFTRAGRGTAAQSNTPASCNDAPGNDQ